MSNGNNVPNSNIKDQVNEAKIDDLIGNNIKDELHS
jgi:hypothetical protein